MDMFVIYLVTRLSDLKDGLSYITTFSGILLVMTVGLRMLNEFFTSAKTKKESAQAEVNDETFLYAGIQRSTKRGLWYFVPVFAMAFCVNLFLPTTRDAVVIAGGYGLVEAVKNERVQRLFSKSTKVASQWLDAQLTPEDKKAEVVAPAAPGAASAASSAASAPVGASSSPKLTSAAASLAKAVAANAASAAASAAISTLTSATN